MLEDLGVKNKLVIRFEYIPHQTPQHNGVVERKFQTLYGRIRSMLISSKLDENLRGKFWKFLKLFVSLIQLINLLWIDVWTKLKLLSHLKRFGEMRLIPTVY